MTRCKPGDLAYITYSRHAENLGKIVEVIKQDMSVGAADPLPGEVRWECLSVSRMQTFDRATGAPNSTPPGSPVSCRDACLRPISGVPVDDEVTEDLKVPA